MLNYDDLAEHQDPPAEPISCGGLLSEVERLRADNDRLRSLQARLVTRELFDTVAAHRDRLAAEVAAAAGRLRVLAEQSPDTPYLQLALHREAHRLATPECGWSEIIVNVNGDTAAIAEARRSWLRRGR